MKVRTSQASGTSLSVRLGALAALMAGMLATSLAQNDPVAAAPELPKNIASSLQVVPGRALLATKVRSKTVPANQTHPPCMADETSTTYECRITTPITVCAAFTVAATYDAAIFPADAKITHYKLTSPSQISKVPATLFHFPIYCSTSDGPWSAELRSDRLCSSNCGVNNDLQVVGIPNVVEFFWTGAFNVPPPGAPFKFVAKSFTKVDFTDFGQCPH